MNGIATRRDLGEGAYVRPLCRRCIEQQYWMLRLVRSETVKAIGDTLEASAKTPQQRVTSNEGSDK